MKSEQLLPKPFEWITISAGSVTLITENHWRDNYIPKEKGVTFAIPAFEMAKYPITNSQFRLFIDAGGYSNDVWWTPNGILQRNVENWTQPLYWNDVQWNGSDYPVVGVSWYEAIAFCNWLSDITGEKILLPSEQQWQRAAQGDDARQYPWGDKWNRLCINKNKKTTDMTTRVNQYEGKGDSPFGIVDMVGNVWEWCLNTYTTGDNDLTATEHRVSRGGSRHYKYVVNFRAIYRHYEMPECRNIYGGFRIMR